MLVCAALLLSSLGIAPGTADETTEIEDDLEATEAQLQQAEASLATLEVQVEQTQQQIQEVEGQLYDASLQLEALEGDLAAAEGELAAAAERTVAVTRRLLAETARLERVQGRLDERQDIFDDRVAAAYKHGTITFADALTESNTFAEFANSYYYVQSAMEFDDQIIDEVTGLVDEVQVRRARVDALRDEAAAEEAAARAARDHIASLAEQQRELTDQIAADRSQREQMLAGLEASQAEYEALVAGLQAESDRLAEELREAQWQAGVAPEAGQLAWPTDGPPGSPFGYRTHPIFGTVRFHAGVDIAAGTGQPIVAAADGVVVSAGYRGGYGNATVVDHGGGLATLYGHQSAMYVAPGQVVLRGETIGAVGATGWATGPHLHFEVRVNGAPQDPLAWY